MDWSKLIETIERASPVLVTGVVVGYSTILILRFLGLLGLDQLGVESFAIVNVVGIVATAFLAVRIAFRLVEHVRKRWGLRRKRHWSELSSEQREFLANTYKNQSRQFQLRDIRPRWFEELRLWNYVQFNYAFGITHTEYSCEIREATWLLLARLDKRNKL